MNVWLNVEALWLWLAIWHMLKTIAELCTAILRKSMYVSLLTMDQILTTNFSCLLWDNKACCYPSRCHLLLRQRNASCRKKRGNRNCSFKLRWVGVDVTQRCGSTLWAIPDSRVHALKRCSDWGSYLNSFFIGNPQLILYCISVAHLL